MVKHMLCATWTVECQQEISDTPCMDLGVKPPLVVKHIEHSQSSEGQHAPSHSGID